jgi:hypothetical protein
MENNGFFLIMFTITPFGHTNGYIMALYGIEIAEHIY